MGGENEKKYSDSISDILKWIDIIFNAYGKEKNERVYTKVYKPYRPKNSSIAMSHVSEKLPWEWLQPWVGSWVKRLQDDVPEKSSEFMTLPFTKTLIPDISQEDENRSDVDVCNNEIKHIKKTEETQKIRNDPKLCLRLTKDLSTSNKQLWMVDELPAKIFKSPIFNLNQKKLKSLKQIFTKSKFNWKFSIPK